MSASLQSELVGPNNITQLESCRVISGQNRRRRKQGRRQKVVRVPCINVLPTQQLCVSILGGIGLSIQLPFTSGQNCWTLTVVQNCSPSPSRLTSFTRLQWSSPKSLFRLPSTVHYALNGLDKEKVSVVSGDAGHQMSCQWPRWMGKEEGGDCQCD